MKSHMAKAWTAWITPRYPGCGKTGWISALSSAGMKADHAKIDVNPWYYDYLDHIANLELKNKPAQQGGTRLRYSVAREQQGAAPLCGQKIGRASCRERVCPYV